MRSPLLIAAFIVSLAAGCGDEPMSPTEGRVANSDTSRTLDTLLFLVTVRAQDDIEPSYFASTHVRAVEFEIDGVDWGAFAPTAGQDAGDESGAWAFTNEPDPAVVVARIGTGSMDAKVLETVGDWVSELQRRLRPGDHVARIIRIRLENGDGEVVTVEPNTLIPFTVAPGESSAWIADLVLTPTTEAEK